MTTNYGNASFNEIMDIAHEQLAVWKEKLNEECFAALQNKCQQEWKQASPNSPYAVFRGCQMNEFVLNYRP